MNKKSMMIFGEDPYAAGYVADEKLAYVRIAPSDGSIGLASCVPHGQMIDSLRNAHVDAITTLDAVIFTRPTDAGPAADDFFLFLQGWADEHRRPFILHHTDTSTADLIRAWRADVVIGH